LSNILPSTKPEIYKSTIWTLPIQEMSEAVKEWRVFPE
jgi:hypothetical protein